jgi:hypothetical protein
MREMNDAMIIVLGLASQPFVRHPRPPPPPPRRPRPGPARSSRGLLHDFLQMGQPPVR